MHARTHARTRTHTHTHSCAPFSLLHFTHKKTPKYCYMLEWLQRGFGLEIGFIDHLQIVTTRNYNAIANCHTLQITAAHVKPLQSVFTCRFPVIDLNNGDSSASVLTLLLSGEYPTTLLTALTRSSLHSLPYNSLWTLAPIVLPTTTWHSLRRKHHSLLYSNHFCGNTFVYEGVSQ
jgi:hypothetical protein